MARAASDPFDDLLKTAEKKYNLRVGSMDDVAEDVHALTTGNMAIDTALGIGGIPLGRSVELYGPPSCGKTTTALQVAADLQRIIKSGGDEARGIKPNDIILYLDYEQAMDKVYANALGLDTKHASLKFSQPDTLEDGVNFAIAAVKTGRVRLVIFDSVAAMNPSAKAEAEIGKSLPAVQAKLMKDFTLNFNGALYNHNATAIFLNHQMEVMAMGGASRPGMPPPTTTPGGKALKYFASVRIEYKQIKQNKASVVDPLTNEKVDRVQSTDVKVKVTKNKVAPPFREAVVRVRFGRGFDNFWTAMQILLANKKVMYSSGRYYFHNVRDLGLVPEWMAEEKTGTHRPYIHGENAVFTNADKDPEWREGLILLAEEVVRLNEDALARVVPLGDDEEEDEEDLDEVDDTLTGGNRVAFE